jgi:hypothetical protein
MQTRNRLLNDLAKVAGGAMSVMSGVKGEAEALMRQQFEKILSKMDLIPREDFEAVRAMAAKARDQQEDMNKRVAVLEAALNIKPPRKPTKKTPAKKSAPKSAAKKTTKKSALRKTAPKKTTKARTPKAKS